jgi:hypothetical protein
MFVSLALVSLNSISYVRQPGEYETPARVAAHESIFDVQNKTPYIAGLDDYLPTTFSAATSTIPVAGVNLIGTQFGFRPDRTVPDHWAVTIPSPETAEALVIQGALQSAPNARIDVLVGNSVSQFPINAGQFALRFPIAEPLYCRPTSFAIDPHGSDGSGWVPIKIDRLGFVPDQPRRGQRVLVGPAETSRLIERGPTSTCEFAVPQPSVVVVPVLHYPGDIIATRLDGKRIDPQNVGRYVAMPVEPGGHTIDVTFTGMRQANVISFVGWTGTLATMAIAKRRRLRRVREPQFALPDAIVGGLVVIACVAIVEGFPRVAQHSRDRERTTYSQDVPGDPGNPPRFAFDNDPKTAWVVPSNAQPKLTINLAGKHARRLKGITLVSRETGLWEAWHRVHVVLKRHGNVVLDRSVRFDDADKVGTHTISFDPVRVDEIELSFAEPVLRTKTGEPVDVAVVSPGYSEIRLESTDAAAEGAK